MAVDPSQALKILMIGGMPPPVGGTTVLFSDLVNSLKNIPSVSLKVINTSRPSNNRISSNLHGLICLADAIRHIPTASIVTFHSSMTGALLFGPFVHMLCRIFRKKWIFRGFGGQFDSWYGALSWVQQRICGATVLRADTVLFERMSSVQFFRRTTTRSVQWYPNNRRLDPTTTLPGIDQPPRRRFVYVGHVKPSKGIRELVDASKMLESDRVTIDVYGPLQDGLSESSFNGSPIAYRGLLPKEEVVRTLMNYDALVLPTYWEGEGHPGVILEAYCAGIPVIATRWGGIPEIVTAETGILVEPRDVRGLAHAMHELMRSQQVLSTLRRGARTKIAEFDSRYWTQYFVDLCRHLTSS